MPADDVSLLFSVVIPTYNRASLLAGMLESLAQQSLDPQLFEVVVVDNASTDETRAVVQAADGQPRVRYVYEPAKGGGAARRTGAEAALGAWIAYTDDDARVSADWLQVAAEILRDQPGLHGMGGQILPFYIAPKPDWFQDRYEIRSWGSTPRFLRSDEAFSGANMLFRRAFLHELGACMTGLGMDGNVMSFGEDAILFERAWKVLDAPRLYYDPRLIVYHAVPARNMNIGYIFRRQFTIGASNVRRNGPRAAGNRAQLALRSAGSIFRLLLRMLRRRRDYARRENWLVEHGKPIAKKLGVLSAALGLNIRFRQREEGKNA